MTLLGSTSGSKANATAWFSSDITTSREGFITIHFAVASSCVLEYTLDGGDNWVDADNGKAQDEGEGVLLELPVTTTDEFNLRQSWRI